MREADIAPHMEDIESPGALAMDVQPQSQTPTPIEAPARTTSDTIRRLPSLTPARSLLGAFSRTCRFDAALAMTTPVIATAAVTWWQSGRVDWLVLGFTLAAAFAGSLGVHLLIEYQDRKAMLAAPAQAAHATAAAEWVEKGPQLLRGEIHSFGLIMLMISMVCSLWLGFLAGWPMLLFGAVSLALGVAYSTPPVRYGNWGFGLGESGIFLALGLIPAVSSYYAQQATLDPLALWSGVPFALLVSLVFIAYTLVNYRRDWLIRKQTLAVSLGPGRAIDLSTILLIGSFAFFLLASIVSGLPLRTMIALLGLPIASGAFNHIDREALPPAQGMRLYTAAIHATLATSLLYTLALITDRLW